jgi:hypothetical protein
VGPAFFLVIARPDAPRFFTALADWQMKPALLNLSKKLSNC